MFSIERSSSPGDDGKMERMNTHSTNRDGLLSRSESRSAATTSSSSHFVLQWGSRKRLRCMKVHNTSEDLTGSRTGRSATARIDRRVVRSDTNNNANKDLISNRQNTGSSFKSDGGRLNLRQRPASPSCRILRNSEGSVGMKGHSNGVKDLASADRKVSSINTNSNRNNDSKNNNVDNDGGSAGVSPETIAAVWPPKFVITLTNKEKEEDFMAIKGSKLPQRPKKRAKLIQRTLNLVSPGAWLCDLTLERYEVREKKVSRKRAGGLKAMGNTDYSESE